MKEITQMPTLEEIRAKLLAQQSKNENRNSTGDKASYPFWNTLEGKTTTIRFLLDGDVNNPFFWVEKQVIKLPFQGVRGEHDNEVVVQVPCMDMYKTNSCPIMAETRPWWKDSSLEALARKYWKKRSYLFQGFVVDSGFSEENPPENPIRRFTINTSILGIIKSILMNPEMEDMPTDYQNGRDFKLTKTKKGNFADYTTSQWSFKTRKLSGEENMAINDHGLFNLSEFLPKQPTADELEIIKEMFQASLNDEAYDLQRWGNYYRPFGVGNNQESQDTTSQVSSKTVSAPAKTVSKPVIKPVTQLVESDDNDSEIVEDAPVEKKSTVDVSSSVNSVLSRLNKANIQKSEPTKTNSEPVEPVKTNSDAGPKSTGKQDSIELIRKIRERRANNSEA
jgi:hypothetical protein